MTQGFYTLEEAANLLSLAADDLNRMAQRREVRAFADRGTWRFRTQDIDEMAQKQGGGTGGGGAVPTALAGSPSGPVTTGIAQGGSVTDLFKDVSLDQLPEENPKTHISPRKGATGVAGPELDDDLIPTGPMLEPEDPFASEGNVDLGDLPPASPQDTNPIPAPASGQMLKEEASFDVNAGGGAPPSRTKPPSMVSKASQSAVNLGSQSAVNLGSQSSARLGGSSAKLGGSSVKLGGTGGKLAGSSVRLGGSSPKLPGASSVRLGQRGDSEVRLDFDSSSDDSLIGVGGVKPDSDVRVDPAGPSSGAQSAEGTEEVDLDAELQQADAASQQRLGKPKPKTTGQQPKTMGPPPKTTGQQPKTMSTPGKTKAPPPAPITMLPSSSPFELSEDDLELPPPSSSAGQVYAPAGSEFELTLAPDDQADPLALGDDEDVDLGDLKPASEMSSSARAELSGINLHDPADSGISLEPGGSGSDSVDFELTVDEDAAGPKTIKGTIPDSDSEFELTLEESGNIGVEGESDAGEQKDIFETDFDLPALEESGSQAVSLEESTDTDMGSSDFDLALDEGDASSTAEFDESGSEVVQLDEEDSAAAAPAPKKRTRGFSAIRGDSEGELVLNEGEEEDIEREAAGEEEETEQATVPAAQAEWGWYPILVLAPCVAIMFVAGLMSYELLHGMWGYHASSKPSGLVVRGMAGLLSDDLPKE